MTLIGADDESDIVIGHGKVDILDPQTIEYEVLGEPVDLKSALVRLRKARENPYGPDIKLTPRLLFNDTSGRRFNAGWISPDVDPQPGGVWRLRGELFGLLPERVPGACVDHSAEVIYEIPKRSRAHIVLSRFCSERVNLKITGADITFLFDLETSLLTITYAGSEGLFAPFVENMLGEPLRIMFGNLLYPRLTARASVGQTTLVQFRSATYPVRTADWLALWSGERALHDAEGFWSMYKVLLSAIVATPPVDQLNSLAPHKITQYYEELIQASGGSRWVWVLALVSTAEAIVMTLFPQGTVNMNADFDDIERLSKYIRQWSGNNDLKSSALQALSRQKEMTAVRALKILLSSSCITDQQFLAWNRTRNAVMHGALVSPYSSEEDDANILALAGLVHNLTRRLVGLSRIP